MLKLNYVFQFYICIFLRKSLYHYLLNSGMNLRNLDRRKSKIILKPFDIKIKKKTKKSPKIYEYPTENNNSVAEQLQYMNDEDLRKLHILMIFLAAMFSTHNKTQTIDILNGYRDRNILIPSTTTDEQIKSFYDEFNVVSPKIKREIMNYDIGEELVCQDGGFYFKRLEEKGDKPITGNDLARLLDEIQGITGNLRYTPEGRHLTTFDVMLGLFRGNEESITSYVKFFVAPRFYEVFPPKLKYIFSRPAPGSPDYDQFDKFAGAPLWDRYEDMADYLLAYQAHQRAKNQYYVDQGLMSPDVLEPGFMEKMTGELDKVATKYSMMKTKMSGKTYVLGM